MAAITMKEHQHMQTFISDKGIVQTKSDETGTRVQGFLTVDQELYIGSGEERVLVNEQLKQLKKKLEDIPESIPTVPTGVERKLQKLQLVSASCDIQPVVGVLVVCNNTKTANLKLPKHEEGMWLMVKRHPKSQKKVTILPENGEQVEGGLKYVLDRPGDSVRLVAVENEWLVVSRDLVEEQQPSEVVTPPVVDSEPKS
jgi:hypothetical protein